MARHSHDVPPGPDVKVLHLASMYRERLAASRVRFHIVDYMSRYLKYIYYPRRNVTSPSNFPLLIIVQILPVQPVQMAYFRTCPSS